MISIKMDGIDKVSRYLEGVAKNQIPFATMTALNDLAFSVRSKEIDLIKSTFDRPKPQTARNIFVRKATKESLRVRIFFDQIYGKDIAEEYMKANISGGSRGMKPSEKRLGSYYVPGIGAKMDAYGNMQGGQITQILSRLGRFGDVAGYDMNETAKSRKRRSGASKSTEYFMIQKQRGGLKPGVYQRTAKQGGFTSVGKATGMRGKTGAFQRSSSGMIQGRGAVPVMLFVKKAPSYKAVWPFFAAAQRLVDEQKIPMFEKALERALRSAR